MSWVAVAVAGSAVIGAAVQSNSANKAANAQKDAAQQATNTQLGMFNQQRADQAPWRNAGSSAVGYLSYLMGLPGYQGGGQPMSDAAQAAALAKHNYFDLGQRGYQSNGTDSTSHGGGFAFDPGAPLGAGLISGGSPTNGWTGLDNTHIGSTSGPSTPGYTAPVGQIANRNPKDRNTQIIPTFQHPGEEGFQQLPSGSTFIGPDGVVRRKH